MTSCVDTLTEKVSYVEYVKKGMALHYLQTMSVCKVFYQELWLGTISTSRVFAKCFQKIATGNQKTPS